MADRWLHLDKGEHAAKGDAVVGGLGEVVAVSHVVVLATLGGAEDAWVQHTALAEVRRTTPEVAFGEVQRLRPGDRETMTVAVGVLLFVCPAEGRIDSAAGRTGLTSTGT